MRKIVAWPDRPIKVVTTRHDGDCAVACLAMLAGSSYEEALLALDEHATNIIKAGAERRHVYAAAKSRFNIDFRTYRKNIEYEDAFGMLLVRSPHFGRDHHVVVIKGEQIMDTNGGWYPLDVYLDTQKAKVVELWQIVVYD